MGINKKYLDALKGSELFENIDEKFLRKLLVPENLFKARKNEFIISNDTKEKFIAVLLKGKTITKTDEQSDKVILSDDEVSDVIGTTLVYSNNNTNIETMSLCNSVYLKITEDSLTEMCMNEKQIYINLMNIMNKRLNFLLKRIKGFTARSAEKKLALYIKDLLKDNKEITIDISMSKLAIMLDLGRASLYRALDTLENNNVIIKNKKQIRVVDFKKFDKLCED